MRTCIENIKGRPGKSCKRCKRRLRTFCRKSRYFEDILSEESRTFVAIYSGQKELRVDEGALRMKNDN